MKVNNSGAYHSICARRARKLRRRGVFTWFLALNKNGKARYGWVPE